MSSWISGPGSCVHAGSWMIIPTIMPFFKIWLVYRHTSTASTVFNFLLHPWASVIHCPNAMAYFPSASWGSRDFLGAGREWGPEVEVQALRGGEDLQKRRPSWVLSENVGKLKSCVWDFWTPCWWNVGPGEESNLTILENLEGPNLNLWDVKEVRWNKTW